MAALHAEQIENLHRDQRVDDHGAGRLDREALRQRPEPHAKAPRHEQRRDIEDAPQQHARQDRAVGGARRAQHGVRLGRLERQRQAQRDGGDHVDPQDLQRRDRQGEAQRDGGEDDQRLAAAGGQRPGDHLHQVVIDRAPFAHRRRDRGEVVVGQHHVRRLLGGFGAFQPHRHAHVGALERGRVVHAVAGHRHDQAARLKRLDQPQLVLGRGAGEHRRLGQRGAQGFVVERVHVGAAQRHRVFGEAELAGDLARGAHMVAGDHQHPHPRRATGGDGFRRFGARRVDEADQAQQRGAVLQRTRVERIARAVVAGEGQHPAALGGQRPGLALPCACVEGAAALQPVAHGDHPLGRALDEDGPVRVQRGHEAAARVERRRVHARAGGAGLGGVQPRLHRQRHQRALHRVAFGAPALRPLAQRGVVAQKPRLDQRRARRAVGAVDRALGGVADALDRALAVGAQQVARDHLVAGQRAGLVGADHRDGAQRLDRGQPADQRVARRHALHADRQRDGHDRGQPLRDRRDRQADHRHERRVGRIAARQRRQREGQRGQPQNRRRQAAREAVHLAQQRRLERLDRAQHGADAAQFGVGSGGDHHARAAARRHEGAGERHRGAVAQARVGGDRLGQLVHRDRFAGQRRFIHLQPARPDQPQVGGHAVSRLQQRDVAGNQRVGGRALAPPVAQHRGRGVDHAPDRRQGALRPALLQKPDQRVDQNHGQDHRRVARMVQRQRQRRRRKQHINQQVVELRQQAAQRPARGGLRQAVGPVSRKARGGLLRRQAVLRRLKPCQRLGCA